MSNKRDDTGLSIAVWENSPWRSFLRFKEDSSDAEPGQTPATPLFRPTQDINKIRHQEQDDVREIFGRALDVARSKKTFASAASVISTRKDVMRSEARLMAEDNRSWGLSGRSKWSRRTEDSSDDLEEYEIDDDDEPNTPESVQVAASPRRPTENSPGSLSRNSSVRAIASPLSHARRGGTAATATVTASIVVDDADGGSATEWASPASPSAARTPSRLANELQSQISLQTRSMQPTQSGSASPWTEASATVAAVAGGIGSPGLGAFGTSAARTRAAKAAAAAGGGGSSVVGPKLLHLQASNVPVRYSVDVHASRKPLSPTGMPPPRRSNSFGEERPGDVSPAAASGGASGTGAAVTHSAGAIGSGSTVLVNDPVLAKMFHDRRAATATGVAGGGSGGSSTVTSPVASHGSTGRPRRGSGGGASFGGGGLEQHLHLHPHPPQHPLQQPAPQQRDAALARNGVASNRSRRAALLAGVERRARGSDGGGGKGPSLGRSPSGRLPDPHGMRLHPVQRPSKMPSTVTAATTAAAPATPGSLADQKLPRASGSQIQLAQLQSMDVRKFVAASVPSDWGRYGPPPPKSSGSVSSEGRSIMGRLKGFFSNQT